MYIRYNNIIYHIYYYVTETRKSDFEKIKKEFNKKINFW